MKKAQAEADSGVHGLLVLVAADYFIVFQNTTSGKLSFATTETPLDVSYVLAKQTKDGAGLVPGGGIDLQF